MKVGEFELLLQQLAALHEAAGDRETANSLRKLAKVFDGNRNQKVAKLLEDIRVKRMTCSTGVARGS